MNNFDFSIYDPLDESTEPIVPSKMTAKKDKEKAKNDFNFDNYDFTDDQISSPQASYEVNSIANDKIYKPYIAKDKTKEELKKMSVKERLEYAQDLNTEREYLQSAGFTKNLLSGATLGATENIDLLKPQEHELNQGLGQLVGAALPIGGAAKAVGIPIKAAFKNAPKILQPLQKFLHAFGTGTAYETGRQGVKAASGNEVDLTQIPIRGAEFATIDAVLRGGSALAKKFLKLSPSHQAQILEKGIIPEDLPKSQYETAEEMLKTIRNQAEVSKPQDRLVRALPTTRSEPGAKIQASRITNPEDIGLRPTPNRQTPSIQDQVGDIFSPNRFYNNTQGGQAFKNEIMNIDEDVYRGVNELYRHSRELNSEINEIHPQLVNRLQARVLELEAIPEPSDVQKRLIKASNNVLKRLAAFDDGGNATGYLPINNQVLIDQVQSLRQIIDYDFAHGDTKNIFRPLINDIQDSALRAAETSGRPEAAEAINSAKSAYRSWVEAFDNDYVRPFRDSSNQDFSKLFKSALDFDETNMLRKILSLSERGSELANASTREIVEKHLSKFMENPRNANPREFNKTLRELESVITPEQTQQIKERFAESSRRPNIRATQQPKRKPTNDELIAARYEKSKPEDIQKMMNSRSGIKELRQDFSDSKVKREVFERLTKQKMRSIFREGNIEKDFTGDDLYKFLNKEKNYEILSEILGETETEGLRKSAKEIGKAQIKSEVRKRDINKAVKKVAVYKTLEIILGIL